MTEKSNQAKLKIYWVDDGEGDIEYLDDLFLAQGKFNSIKHGCLFLGKIDFAVGKREMIIRLMSTKDIKSVLISHIILKEK